MSVHHYVSVVVLIGSGPKYPAVNAKDRLSVCNRDIRVPFCSDRKLARLIKRRSLHTSRYQGSRIHHSGDRFQIIRGQWTADEVLPRVHDDISVSLQIGNVFTVGMLARIASNA